MSDYQCFVDGHQTGEIVAPSFNPDGTIRTAVVVYVDLNDKEIRKVETSFCHLPSNWRESWVERSGAILYIDRRLFGNPYDIGQELNAAETFRQAGALEAQLATGSTGIPTLPEGSTFTPSHPIDPTNPLKPVDNPMDLDKDGVVTKFEKQEYKRQHPLS